VVVLGRCVGVSFIVVALFAMGASGVTQASADVAAPDPNHLIMGAPIALPPALTLSNPVGSATLVTPTQASAITATLWRVWEQALISRDTTALTQISAPGALLNGELYECAWPSLGCVPETTERPVNSVTTIVPVQQTYPIYFLAEVSTIQDIANLDGPAHWVPWVELQVLTKASASAPWRLSFDTGYDGTDDRTPPLLPFELQPLAASTSSPQADQYNGQPAPAVSTPAPAFLSLLAQYYQSFKDTGRPPPGSQFAAGGAADGYGSQLATNPQDNVALGSRNHYDFTADPGAGEWEFSGPGGLPIECGTVLDTSTNAPVGGPVLLQNPDRTNWGMALAPGAYTKVITDTTHPTCVFDVGGVLDAAGDSGYTIGVSGPRGSIVPAGLVLGLGIAVLAVVVISGVIVGVAVLVTRRRRLARPIAVGTAPMYSWSGGPPNHWPPQAPPPPSPWAPPPPPPPPPPPSPWPPPLPDASTAHAWSPPGTSTRFHTGVPVPDPPDPGKTPGQGVTL
jgi:hypothetical protein